jgi:hypothetical protein
VPDGGRARRGYGPDVSGKIVTERRGCGSASTAYLACVDEIPSSALRCMFGGSKSFVAARVDGGLARISRAELWVTGGES